MAPDVLTRKLAFVRQLLADLEPYSHIEGRQQDR